MIAFATGLNGPHSGVPTKPLSLGGLADLYLTYLGLSIADGADLQWTCQCVDNLVEDHPKLAFSLIQTCIARLDSTYMASLIAAGSLEDLIRAHGAQMIDLIDAEAAQSARFRFVLSGVWPQGEDENGEVWQRVLRARAPGPNLDSGNALPPE